jgi:acyl-coenzyme A synthetase/AMP-(fatty) acid ligase
METGLLIPVLAGCSVRLLDGFDAPVALRELRSGATVFPGVPYMFEALSLLASDGLGTGSLRLAFSAGAPMSPAVEAGFRARTGLRVGQLYGATELGWVAFGDPERSDFDPSSVGCPLPGVRVLILDPDDADPERPVEIGVEGQVAVASPSMLSGYVGSPTPLRGGYFLTGDLGRLDASGNLTLTGRLSMHIDVGGLKVNAFEVEQVLLQHPGVGECVVVPLRMSETVNRIRAVLTPAIGVSPASLSADELRRFARARLAPHKVPRVFEIRDSLPRSASGKVQRHELGAL